MGSCARLLLFAAGGWVAGENIYSRGDAMSVSNTSRRRALLFASLLISALVLTNCGKVPIDVVVMKELCDENGFDADLGYHADDRPHYRPRADDREAPGQ